MEEETAQNCKLKLADASIEQSAVARTPSTEVLLLERACQESGVLGIASNRMSRRGGINHSSGMEGPPIPESIMATAGFGEGQFEGSAHDITQYHFSHAFEVAVECINTVAGLIVLFAVLLAGANLLIIAFNVASGFRIKMVDPLHYSKNEEHTYCIKSAVLRIRLMMSEQIALALGLLVASDILDTVLKPSHAYQLLDVTKMGFVTILRTGLAYFLAREIKDLEVDHQLKQRSVQQLISEQSRASTNERPAAFEKLSPTETSRLHISKSRHERRLPAQSSRRLSPLGSSLGAEEDWEDDEVCGPDSVERGHGWKGADGGEAKFKRCTVRRRRISVREH